MKRIRYSQAKERIIEFTKENFSDFYQHEEFNAAMTHWIQSPEICPPLMPPKLYFQLPELMKKKQSSKQLINARMIADPQQQFQPSFQFVMDDIPFPPPKHPDFTFIDLFAGIGGFRIAMQELGGKCVFSSEWDKYAKKTYEANFGEVPYGDINQFASANISDNAVSAIIPEHDILCAGFPCQPFSLAGVSKKQSMGRKHGFEDKTQGTLFFNIAKIIAAKQPKAFFLENVKNLLSHDKGQTWEIIENTLNELGYIFQKKVVDGASWVPQHRERIFIVGYNPHKVHISQNEIIILENPSLGYKRKELKEIIKDGLEGYTLGPGTWDTLVRHKRHHAEAGNGFGYGMHSVPIKNGAITRTISARYHKDGAEILIEQPGKRPRRLAVEEAMQLQGYNPKKFIFSQVSNTQAYKQIGNSVVVPAILDTAREIVKVLKEKSK